MIWIYDSQEAFNHGAAGFIAQQARRAVEQKGRFSIVLSGGSTPRGVYELLAQEPYAPRIDWNQVEVFWGDERCVPQDDPRRNALMAQQALLDRVPIPPEQIYPMPCWRLPPLQASQQYDRLLHDYFTGRSPVFDLVLLGLGEDGHTASLFPGTAVLQEKERWVSEVYLREQEMWRITLTPEIINQAVSVAFLVKGAGKAGAVREILEHPHEGPRLPAQLIQPASGGLYWLLDQEAGSLLTQAA